MTTTSKSLKFRPADSDYAPGDEREYEVHRYGRYLGLVGRCWLVSATEGGTPLNGWSFRSVDGSRYGEGRTRKAAVQAALATPAVQS